VSDEGAGLIPSEKFMNKRFGKNGWSLGSLVNWGIGQGEVSVTPLQMAAYTATLANKGVWNQPHLARALRDKKTGAIKPLDYASHRVPIDPQHFDVVLDGMFDVANTPGGTAYSYLSRDGARICGKTGTAQNAHGKDHTWFVCFAPRENPVIALCVMMENTGGTGGEVAAPVAQKIIGEYIRLRESRAERERRTNAGTEVTAQTSQQTSQTSQAPAQAPTTTTPQPSTQANTQARTQTSPPTRRQRQTAVAAR
jgi:penicillin-binding protein 2